MILSKELMGGFSKPITREEWNKLAADEKMVRVERFDQHVKDWNRLGIPTSMGDLVSIAIRYQVPIPTSMEGDTVLFEGFD